jgi:hypothetical protein
MLQPCSILKHVQLGAVLTNNMTRRTYILARNEDIPADGNLQLGSLLSQFDNPESLVQGFKRVPWSPANQNTVNHAASATVGGPHNMSVKTDVVPTKAAGIAAGSSSGSAALQKDITIHDVADTVTINDSPGGSTPLNNTANPELNVTSTQTYNARDTVFESGGSSMGLWVKFMQLVTAKLGVQQQHEWKITKETAHLDRAQLEPTREYVEKVLEQQATKDYIRENTKLGVKPKLYLVTGIRKAPHGTSGQRVSLKARAGDIGVGTTMTPGSGVESGIAAGSNSARGVSSSHSGSSSIVYAWRVHQVHYCVLKRKFAIKNQGGQIYGSARHCYHDESDSEDETDQDIDYEYDGLTEVQVEHMAKMANSLETGKVSDDGEQVDFVLAKSK